MTENLTNHVDKYRLNETMDHFVKAAGEDIERRFKTGIDQQSAISGKSPDGLIALKEQAKEHITQTLIQQIRSQGWWQHQPESSNVRWEAGKGPLLNKRWLSLQQLTLKEPDIAGGGFGSVSLFENEHCEQLIGKTAKPKEDCDEDSLGEELEAYKTIYSKAGLHPNLVNVYGIAEVPHGGEVKRTLLMDKIPGMDGIRIFSSLKKHWDDGGISSAEYWGAIQFIGRRMLDVTEHLAKAGVVHNDIKPGNFMVNENTGEPVLLDLGTWSKEGARAHKGTLIFASPETINAQDVDERSDVFTVGTSLRCGTDILAGGDRELIRRAPSHSATTAHTKFMESVLKENKDERPNSGQAKNMSFLNDSMLDDDAAREVIRNVITGNIVSFARDEGQSRPLNPDVSSEFQDIMQNVIPGFLENPTLSVYAELQKDCKTNPQLEMFMDMLKPTLNVMRGQIEQDAENTAQDLMANAKWFDPVKGIAEIAEEVSKQTILKSGVDTNGDRLEKDGTSKNAAYIESLKHVRSDISPYAKMDELRAYVAKAEAFLSDVQTLHVTSDTDLARQIGQVKARVEVARKMVKLDETIQSLDTEPEKINIRERGLALEPKLPAIEEQAWPFSMDEPSHDELVLDPWAMDMDFLPAAR